MTRMRLAIIIASSLAIASAGLAQFHPVMFAVADATGAPMQMDMSNSMDEGIPSYHAYALKPPFPTTIDPKQFPDALNRNIYALAAKIKPVLFQQPCYCFCDRHEGHKSLLDCYASIHGSQCDICQKEAVFAYQQTQKGKTPAQIRSAIIQGDWKSVSLQPYVKSTTVQ